MLPDTISPVHVHPGLRYGGMGTKNVQLVLHISAKQVKRDVTRFNTCCRLRKQLLKKVESSCPFLLPLLP